MHTEQRIGNPGSIDAATGERFTSGGVIRVIRCYPGQWDAHVVIADGTSAPLKSFQERPGYKDLDAAITEGRAQGLEIFEKGKAIWRGSTAAVAVAVAVAADEPGEGGTLTGADVDAMDKASLQRLLSANGVSTSGRIAVLRQRAKALVEAQ